MTKEQAQECTNQLGKVENMLMRAMEDLEWRGILTPDLEEAFNIIQNLPEYEANE